MSTKAYRYDIYCIHTYTYIHFQHSFVAPLVILFISKNKSQWTKWNDIIITIIMHSQNYANVCILLIKLKIMPEHTCPNRERFEQLKHSNTQCTIVVFGVICNQNNNNIIIVNILNCIMRPIASLRLLVSKDSLIYRPTE